MMKYHALLALLLFPLTIHADTPIVSDNDLVMTRQEYGETCRDRAVGGGPLTIANKVYAKGIGSHATSMIPVSVPQGATALRGACGVDDGTGGNGTVRFAVLSGSEILWQSEVMRGGMPAAAFHVPVPVGTRKLYLLADHVDDNSNDHADWVDLAWETIVTISHDGPRVLKAEEHGLKPGSREDQTAALARLITKARACLGSTITIPKGEYHFYSEGALRMSFHISNHDQPVFHPVSVPLVDLRGITIEGNGSVFIFHGPTLPLLIMDSSDVTVNNLSLDYERTYYSEGVIKAFLNGEPVISIDPERYPHRVDGDKITFIGEGWEHGISSVMAFKKDTKEIAENTADMSWSGKVKPLGKNRYRLKWDLESRGLEVGDTLVLRSWGRPHPACTIYRSSRVTFNNTGIHNSMGMAWLAQRSEDITISGGGTYLREGCGRVYTASADATHFSNVKGLIKVEKALFEGMMDDAINVHSTCLSVAEIRDSRTMLCRYMHGQSVGFEVFLPGEMLRFIAGPTLENKSTARVAAVRKLNTKEVLITLESDIPEGVTEGDAVENADYYPEVVFKENMVRHNRARGSLFTTPRPVLVEGNNFHHSSGSAILLAGDAQGWYESGACEDVVIRGNLFTNNLTSRYQFTNALISIYPEVRQLDKQESYYHRNVLIEGNLFKTFDVPLLFAISTQGLTFRHNTIQYNDRYQGWGQQPFQFKRCADIRIYGNTVDPAGNWSLKDCKLEMTPESEISFDEPTN